MTSAEVTTGLPYEEWVEEGGEERMFYSPLQVLSRLILSKPQCDEYEKLHVLSWANGVLKPP